MNQIRICLFGHIISLAERGSRRKQKGHPLGRGNVGPGLLVSRDGVIISVIGNLIAHEPSPVVGFFRTEVNRIAHLLHGIVEITLCRTVASGEIKHARLVRILLHQHIEKMVAPLGVALVVEECLDIFLEQIGFLLRVKVLAQQGLIYLVVVFHTVALAAV